MSASRSDRVKARCQGCGQAFVATRKQVEKHGKDVYCEDCTIVSECRFCEQRVKTTHDSFAKFDGKPVCEDCGPVDFSRPFPDMDAGSVLGRRIIASIVDLVAIFVFAALFGYVMEQTGMWAELGLDVEQRQIAFAAVALVAYLYNYVYLEAASGQSIGKELVGIIVVREDGTRCTLGPSLVRNLLRPLDAFFAYGVGFLNIVFSSKDQRLGDQVAGTVVVRVET